MKKFNKIFTFLMAVCMLCAVALPASAVDMNTGLSEYAGGTLVCQVTELTNDGGTKTTLVDVSIPVGATKAEENALVQAAIADVIIGKQARNAGRAIFDTINTKENFAISAYTITDLGGGKLTADYKTLIGQFDITAVTGTTWPPYPYLTVTFTGGGHSASRSVEVKSGSNVLAIVKNSDSDFVIEKDMTVKATATVDIGRLTVGTYSLLATDRVY